MRHCCCNYIPHIGEYFDTGDLAGLIAPRKLVVVNGAEDTIFPKKGVDETMETIRSLYRSAGAPDNVCLVTGSGGHRFYADLAWPEIHRYIGR